MIKQLLFKILFQYRSSSKSYIRYLRKKGCIIGDGTTVFYPRDVMIDITNPCLIQIGKNVQITKHVSILTHGYEWSVIKGKYGHICGSTGSVKIGDNVFIGFNSTILKGVTIGNNVIIGANTLVNHDIPDNSVAVGNPAKVVSSLSDFFEKTKSRQLQEAENLFIQYYERFNKIPEEKIMREYIFLFKERSEDLYYDKIFDEIGSLLNNKDETFNVIMNTPPMFNGYDQFTKHCLKKIKATKRNA